MARRSISAKQPAKNIGPNPPMRQFMGPDGVLVKEKLCPIPFSRKCVAPDGDVVMVVLANGYTIRGFKGNDYGVQKWEEKLKAGFLPYDECPVAGESMRKGVYVPAPDAQPCAGKFSDRECCPHLRDISLARKDAKRKEQMAADKSFATHPERLVAAMEKQLAGNADGGARKGGGVPRG